MFGTALNFGTCHKSPVQGVTPMRPGNGEGKMNHGPRDTKFQGLRPRVERMQEGEWLAKRFEENRGHLRAVAYRMLGSASEADDALQEAWLKLSRADTSGVHNLGGWLT